MRQHSLLGSELFQNGGNILFENTYRCFSRVNNDFHHSLVTEQEQNVFSVRYLKTESFGAESKVHGSDA